MNIKRVVALLCVIALLFTLAGCGDKSKLVGEWYYNGKLEYTFYSDGTCKIRGQYGTCSWDIVDGKLKVVNVYSQSAAVDYTISGDKLIIGGTTYTRKFGS